MQNPVSAFKISNRECQRIPSRQIRLNGSISQHKCYQPPPPAGVRQSPKSKAPHSKRYLLIYASRGSSTAEFFILALSQSSFSRPLKKSGAGQEQLIKAATTDCLL